MNNKINLCFLADDNYAMQTCVTISSLHLNRNKATAYSIYVIINNGSNENTKRIKSLEDVNFKITIIDIDKIKELTKFDIADISASPTAICKFYIPKILEKIDKVLYIDGDVIIKGDLLELYNIDIKNNYIGAVKDTCGLSKSLYGLSRKNNIFYFNSGVMIMNLKKMRKENIPDRLMEYRLTGYNQLMDQDALNFVLKGKVFKLPFKYNTQLCCFDDTKRFSTDKQLQVLKEYFKLPSDIKKHEDIIDSAIILHYSGGSKPWNKNDTIENDLWTYYYYHSPFRNILLYKKPKNKTKATIASKIIKRTRRYRFMHNFSQNKE